MPSNATDALKHLTTTFTVKDIMTVEARLRTGADAASAQKVSAENPDFSVIPIKINGVLSAYFERDSRRTASIEIDDLISDGTTLLELIEVLRGREFSFVLTNRRIEGYVHYSDLNHQLVKWTFYVMLEAVERMALERLRLSNDPAYINATLGTARFSQVEKAYKRAGDNARNLLTYLNIADILKLAVSEEAVQVDEASIRSMKRVRDWAAHVLDDLAPDTAVEQLATVKRECLRLLGADDTQKRTAAYV